MLTADDAPNRFVYDAADRFRHDLKMPLTTIYARAYISSLRPGGPHRLPGRFPSLDAGWLWRYAAVFHYRVEEPGGQRRRDEHARERTRGMTFPHGRQPAAGQVGRESTVANEETDPLLPHAVARQLLLSRRESLRRSRASSACW